MSTRPLLASVWGPAVKMTPKLVVPQLKFDGTISIAIVPVPDDMLAVPLLGLNRCKSPYDPPETCQFTPPV